MDRQETFCTTNKNVLVRSIVRDEQTKILSQISYTERSNRIDVDTE